MYASEKATAYLNFLSLFSDIDAKGFRQILIPELIGELLSAFDSIPIQSTIPINSQMVRHSFIAFRSLVFVNLTEEEYRQFEEPAETNRVERRKLVTREPSRHFFSEAQQALVKGGIVWSKGGGRYDNGRLTVVAFYEERYQFILQAINELNLDFVKIEQRRNARHQTVADDDNSYSRLLPSGFLALTMDATNILNSLKLYDSVNNFLAESVESIVFDSERALALLNLIERETMRQTRTTFAF